ncbi:MAG: leucine-rich repeat protein, partial [Ruminococcus sp.]|nr:leucine-rich repeat protein [Ruminococcus sp.]
MKKKFIRLVSVLLTVLMLSAVMITPLSVSAANTDKPILNGEDTGAAYVDISSYKGAVSDFSYEVYGDFDEKVRITGYKGTGGDVIIPAEIDGKPVTKIEEGAFKDNATIRNMIISASVTSIGAEAFKGCSDLFNIFVPASVSYIHNEAFSGCSRALMFWTQLSSQAKTYASKNGYDYGEVSAYFYRVLSGNKLEIVSYIGVPEGTAGDLYIPSAMDGKSVTQIATYAFANNKSIKSVDMAGSITSIGDYAFGGCSNLESAVIPASVTAIEGQPFFGCNVNFRIIAKESSAAYNWAVSNHISYVEDNTEASNPDDFEFYAPDEYGNVMLKSYKGSGGNVVIPSRYKGYIVTSIGAYSFSNNKKITSLTIPKSVTSISDYACGYCQNLRSISFPDTLGRIGSYAFTLCTSLKSVTLPDTVYSLGAYAFYNCTGLEKVTLPDNNLQTINAYTFSGCTSLKSICIPKSVEKIDTQAFSYCENLSGVLLQYNLKTIGSGAFACCPKFSNLAIPSSVTTIEESAFVRCVELSSLVIPASVKEIKDFAFYGCKGMASVKFYSGSVSIESTKGYQAFGDPGSGLVFYGYTPSTAQTYAAQYNIPFRDLSSQNTTPTSNYYYSTNGIDRTYVATFAQAWSAASNSSSTVGILTDVQISDTLSVRGYINLELNGHKLDRGLINADASNDNGSVFYVERDASLNIYGGTKAHPKPSCSVSTSVWWPNGTIQDYTVENRGVITGGYTSSDGGGIYVDQGGCVDLHYTAVTGNRAEGDYEFEDCEYGFGGGICLYGNECELYLDNSEVSCNYARKGGGVAVVRKENDKYSSMSADNCVIEGDGKGVLGECPSTISTNFAVVYGGGAYFDNGYCSVKGVQFDNNYSNEDGGGVYTIGEYCTFEDCVITENNSKKNGGGVYNGGSSKSAAYNTYKNVEISVNVASKYGDGVYNAQGIDVQLEGYCGIYGNGEYPKYQNLYMSKFAMHNTSGNGNTPMDYRNRTGYVKAKLDLNSNAEYGVSGVYVTYASDRGDTRLTKFGDTSYVKYFESDKSGAHFVTLPSTEADYLSNYLYTQNGPYITLVAGDKPQPTPVMQFETRKAVDITYLTYNDQPVKRGVYTYAASGGDCDAVFYYSDGYFMENAQNYNDHLATLSACMANAAMNARAGSTGDDGNYTFKGKNIHQMMIDMGCKNSDIFLSDSYARKPEMDSIGYCIATKKLSNGDDLVIIAVRGGGYESEWSSNVTLGKSGEHAGFANAANQVFSGLEKFLEKKNITGTSSTTKFWISGFSRAGATSNLTAKRIIDNYNNNGKRTFAYPIEAPKGGVASAIKSTCNYESIHNIINFRDIVPWVAMGDLGFIRYGVDHFLPGTNVPNKYTEGVTHDNYTEILGTDSYNAQKQKMLKQLKLLNPDAEYDDYFHTGSLYYMSIAGNQALGAIPLIGEHLQLLGPSGKLIQETKKGDRDYNMSVEDWLMIFWQDFVNYTFTSKTADDKRDEYAAQKPQKGSTKTFEESLRGLLDLFMAPSEKSDKFMDGFSYFEMGDISIPLLLKIYTNYLNTALNTPLTSETYDDIFSDLWDTVKGKLEKGKVSKDDLELYRQYFYTALRFILRYVKTDYDKNNQNDLGTILYNAGRLIQNHDTDLEVPQAWIRSYDSYYTGTGSIQADVKYTGSNRPKYPNLKVKDATSNAVTEYNQLYSEGGMPISIGLYDKIRFIPNDSTYDVETEGDTYYFCIGEPITEGNSGIFFNSRYKWFTQNDWFTLDDYSDYITNNTIKINVFSERDGLLSNGDKASMYKNLKDSYNMVPSKRLVRTFIINIKDSSVIACADKYNSSTQSYDYTEFTVAQNSTRTIKGVKPGVESEGDRWVFDHWEVFKYNPSTNKVDRDNPVSSVAYRALFGNGFNAKSETTTVKNCDGLSYFFEAFYTKLSSCTVSVPESATNNVSSVSALSKGKLKFSTSSESDSSLYKYESKEIAYDTENPVSIDIETVKPVEYIEDGYMWSFKCWRVYPYNTLTKTVDRAHPIDSSQYADLLGKDFKPEAKKTTVTNLTNQDFRFEPVYEAQPIKYTTTAAFPKSFNINYNSDNELFVYSTVEIPYIEDSPRFITIRGVKPSYEATADIFEFDHWNVYLYDTKSGTADKNNPVPEKYYEDYFGSSFNPDSENTKVYNFNDKDYLFEPVYKTEVTDGDFTYTIVKPRTVEAYAVVKSYSGTDANVTIPSSCSKGNHTWSVKGIESNAFKGNKSITKVTIPKIVESIGDSAFEGCTGLTDATITRGVAKIGARAFKGCTGLERLTIPKSVTSIGADAFADCVPALTIYGDCGYYAQNYAYDNGIKFIDSSETIQYAVVNGKAVITGFIAPEGFDGRLVIPSLLGAYDVTTISANAFKDNTDITRVTIPDSVSKIDKEAFSGCSRFTDLVISGGHGLDTSNLANLPNTITDLFVTGDAIKANAFTGLTSVKNVRFGNNISGIGANAFRGCSSLTGLSLPDSTASISDSAFRGCSNLERLTFRNSITSIGDYAFQGCSNLVSATFANSNTSIGSNAFADCKAELTIAGHRDSTAERYANNNGINFASLDIEGVYSDDLIYEVKDGKVIIAGRTNTEASILNIPPSIGLNPVTEIKSYAFDGNYNIKSVIIPASVETIGYRAFMTWSDAKYTVYGYSGSAAETYVSNHHPFVALDGYSFSATSDGKCSVTAYTGSSDKLIIPSVCPGGTVTGIAANAFKGKTNITNVSIPNTVTSIGGSAFEGCTALTGLTIPDSVTSIGADAFKNCGSGFTINCNDSSYAENYASSNSIKRVALDGFTFKVLVGGTVAVTGYNGDETDLIIPSTDSEGRVVSEIYSSAFASNHITSVVIPSSVERIHGQAFSYCEQLTSVTIPSSVNTIDYSAFSNCTSLESITIPGSVTTIGGGLFDDCTGLTSVIIGSGVTVMPSFSGCSNLKSVTIPDSITTIGASVFYKCKSLESITIPSGVTSIGKRAFQYCYGLKSATIPDSVTSINDYAFSSCIGLEKVYIPVSVTDIGDSAFDVGNDSATILYGYRGSAAETYAGNSEHFVALDGFTFSKSNNGKCSISGYTGSATELYLPELCSQGVVKGIKSEAFKNNTKISTVIIPDTITSIDSDAFDGCSEKLTIYGNNLSSEIKAYASDNNIKYYDLSGFDFGEPADGTVSIKKYNGAATEIDIPDRDIEGNIVTGIGADAFYNNSNISVVTIPDTVTSIGKYAFRYCSSLTSVIIPDGVTSIETSVFENCSSLTSVIIPSGVTSIGYNAFKGCSGLTSVTIPSGVTTISGCAFEGCSGLTNIKIPDGVTTISGYVFEGCSGLTSVRIPESVTSIGDSAFKGCSGLTSVKIPESVTSIGSLAFAGCTGLTKAIILSEDATFDNNAFPDVTIYGCSGSTAEAYAAREGDSYYIPAQGNNPAEHFVKAKNEFVDITEYLSYSFSEPVESTVSITKYSGTATELNIVDTDVEGNIVTGIDSEAFDGCTSLKSVTIPGSVSAISSFAFCDCSNLETVTIGDGVKEIGDGAFYDCKKLSEVNIPASVETIAETAFEGCESLNKITIDGDYQLDDRSLAALKRIGVQNLTITGSSIKDGAFNGFTELKNVEISDTVENIGINAFNNSGITDIEIPDGVKTINKGTFRNCSELKSVTLPDSVSSIGLYAFK